MKTPAAKPTVEFLTARWMHLAMLNYEVDSALLADRVPAGVELDSFAGKSFLSMVGFQFLDTRVLGIPIPFLRDFEEVNLRFYVRRESAEGLRRGVVFVKELVPRRAIAWLARRLYNENYEAVPMSHQDELTRGEGGRIHYGWEHREQHCGLSARITGEPYLPEPDSEEAFITEHYWGYVRQRSGATVEYQVRHPRWPVWWVAESSLECDTGNLYGAPFADLASRTPSSAFVAVGSEVAVHRGRRLD